MFARRAAILSGGLDADAMAFCARSGATDRRAVSGFVRGVKLLGLWNNMVCWPLRSAQNAGTGTTAFSLGGLGTFNGTLVNGPTWGANGIETNASSQRITTTRSVSGYSTRTFFSVANLTDGGNRDRLMISAFAEPDFIVFNEACSGFSLAVTAKQTQVAFAAVPTPGNVVTTTGGSEVYSTWRSFMGSFSSRIVKAFRDGAANGTDSVAGGAWADSITDGNPLCMIGGVDDESMTGTMSFAMDCTEDISSISAQIHSLYRSTLGAGLGLP